MVINNNKKYGLILFALCLMLYFFFAYHQMKQLPKYDEPDFIVLADSINEKGIPIAYWGEESSVYWGEKENYTGLIYGVWHPPLYTYSLALLFRIIGNSYISARIFGMLCNLLVLYFVYLICRLLFKKPGIIFLIASLIYLINPLLINHSLMLVMDTSILHLLLTVFIYYFIKTIDEKGIRKYLVLSVIFAVSLWAKFTTPPFLIISIFIFYLFKKKIKEAFKAAFLIGFLGLSLFLFSWWIYTLSFGIPFLYPFDFLFFRVSSYSYLGYFLVRYSKNIYDLFWLSPPFLILLFLYFLSRLKKIKEGIKKIDFILIYSLIVYIITPILSNALYKKFPLISMFSLMIAYYIYEKGILNIKKKEFILYSAAILILFVYYLLIKDIILDIPKILPITAQSYYIFCKIGLYLLPLFLVPLLIILHNSFNNIMKSVALGMFLVMIPMNLALDFQQSSADYSTISVYGEKGFEESLKFITENTDNDYILSRRDLTEYTNNKYVWASILTEKDYDNHYNNPAESLALLNKYDFKFIIYNDYLREIQGNLLPEVKKFLSDNYLLAEHFGNYYIYKKK